MPQEYAKQLGRIKIRGYRSIKNTQIEFGRANILIGSNGAGKSNFISAFELLGRVLSGRLENIGSGTLAGALFYSGGSGEIEFEALFGDVCYSFALTPAPSGGVCLLRERFCRVRIEAGCELLQDESRETLFPLLRNHRWRVYHFHDVGVHSAMRGESRLSDNRSLRFDAGNLAAFLYRLRTEYPQNYTEIVHTLRLIAPYFDAFHLEPEQDEPEQILLRWKQNGLHDLFDASHFSDGTLRFLCLAVLLLQPPELSPSIIIIDEPELGLHPFALTIFSELIGQLPEEKQIIISTQSVELLNEFEPEDVIVADRDESGSTFKRLDLGELSGWLDAGYSLGELWKKNLLGGRLSR